MQLSEKYSSFDFAKAFHRLISQDEDLADEFGLELTKAAVDSEIAEIFNTVTRVDSIPKFMLNSGRIYMELVFRQDEKLLFRCNSEIGESLNMSESILRGSRQTLLKLHNEFKSLKPVLDRRICRKDISSILSEAKKCLTLIDDLTRRLAKPTRKGKKIPTKRKASKTKKWN